MLRKFNSDPFYFLRYYVTSLTLFVALDVLLVIGGVSIVPQFKLWHFALVPVGIYIGVLSAAMIHNAAHQNIRPRWLNRLIGELCAVHQLYGFIGWQVPHLLHHKHPDDPELDPHPPGDLSFGQFALGMRDSLRGRLAHAYATRWGTSPRMRRIWIVSTVAARLGMYVRMLFWFLLLGPELFLCCYLPSYVANVLFFAHFNYYTHRPAGDGSQEILNLDHNAYYKFVNRVFFGVYFHRNHHLSPSLFNPMRGMQQRQEPRPTSQPPATAAPV